MSSTKDRIMPVAKSARKKSDGSEYTPEDREAAVVIVDGHQQHVQRVPYFETVQNGGIRQYESRPFPTTVFRAYADASTQGRTALRDTIAQNEQHLADLKSQGWYGAPQEAYDAHEGSERAIARAAAEVAASAAGMSEKAQREYRKRSADSPHHITE